MKTLGVVLATCCAAVLMPSTARANPIGAGACATDCVVNTDAAAGTLDGGLMFAIPHTKLADMDDAVSVRDSGLEASARFASSGSLVVFADDHAAASEVGVPSPVTFALRQDGHEGDQGEDHDADATETATATVAAAGAGHGDPPAVSASAVASAAVTAAAAGAGPGSVSAAVTSAASVTAAASVAATPEPASVLLLGSGLAGLFLYRRQRSA